MPKNIIVVILAYDNMQDTLKEKRLSMFTIILVRSLLLIITFLLWVLVRDYRRQVPDY